MFVSALFPQGAERTAARSAIFAFVLAALVAILFPVSVSAGTGNLTDRVLTTAALVVAGLVLRLGRGHLLSVGGAGALLLAASFLTGALWLVLFAAVACLYTATGLVERRPSRTTPEITPAPDDVRDILEALGTALVLALVVREFGFEAFKIPTGSMEPTILGDDRGGSRQGDRLLAFKPMPVFRGPERWEIWVFRYPLYRPTNYIKRIVGVPGDHLALRGGDVYVRPASDPAAPLRIVPKPDAVQEAMWRAPGGWQTNQSLDERFRAGGSDWTLLPHALVAAVPAGETQWVDCVRAFEDDLRASADVSGASWTESSVFSVHLTSDKGDVQLDVRRDGATITAPGADGAPAATPIDLSGAALGSSFRIGLSTSDRIARVFVNGRQHAKLPFADGELPRGGLDTSGRVAFGAAGFSAQISEILVENDAQYRGNHSWTLGPDDYIALGDNVDGSQDSRAWVTNVIRTNDGREFTAPTEARIRSENHAETNLIETDDEISFHDAYGVPHRLRKDELPEGGIGRGERRPFVNRGDLVGPAFLIFWPVPPAGGFRPRIVR